MANVRYFQRGKKKLWAYNIRDNDGRSLAYKSGFKTKKNAIIDAEILMAKIRTGSRLNNSITVVDLYKEWLELKIMPSNKSEATKKKYYAKISTIKKLFGDKRVVEIKHSDYQRIMNEYGKTVGKDYLTRINNHIRSALQMAISDKLMFEDFTANVELHSENSVQKVEEKFLHSETDYTRLMDTLKNRLNFHKTVVPYVLYFLFATGMRFGELIAITWKDINVEERTIKTYRRLNTVTNQFVPPKNRTSIRSVPMNKEMLSILNELKESQRVTNENLNIINEHGLVFQHFGYKNGVPNIATVNKALEVLLKKMNISPVITTKGARHTYGSYLWHRGIDLGVIAKILGHKDISMLIKVYGHTLEEKVESEYDNVREIL